VYREIQLFVLSGQSYVFVSAHNSGNSFHNNMLQQQRCGLWLDGRVKGRTETTPCLVRPGRPSLDPLASAHFRGSFPSIP
jgi:hypothetical protein